MAALLGCRERRPAGKPDQPGSTLTGFRIARAERPSQLALQGAHRFSRYALTFEIEASGNAGGSVIRAITDADFPGTFGRGYRALVIGSGAHRRLVRRILARVGRLAESPDARPAGWRIERETEINRSAEDVFAFVADSRNDPRWCPRVISCEQRKGDSPGLGARYEAVHRPTLRRWHTRTIEVTEFEAPRVIRSLQSDAIGDFTITYQLQSTPRGTRLAQRDEIVWKLPRPFRPFAQRVVARHIADQLAILNRVLESGGT